MTEMTEILVQLLYWGVFIWLCGLVAACLFTAFPSLIERLKRFFFADKDKEE